MADLDEQILAAHAARKPLCPLRRLIAVQQVLRDSRSLCLPVAPDAHRAVMDPVSPDRHIDGCMHLDARNLRAAKLHHIVDMVDMVVFDHAEDAAHAADDPALLTVMDVVAADDMASDLFLQPAIILSSADRVALHLGRALHVFCRKIVVVLRVVVLAQTDARALAVRDLAVLDDPALRPVRTNHAVLESGRRRPGRRGFCHHESGDCDVPDSLLLRHEALSADIDLHIFLVRVLVLEIRIEDRLVSVLLRVPLVNRLLRPPGIRTFLRLQAVLQCLRLVQHPVIQVDRSGVSALSGKVPVAIDIGRIRIVVPEDAIPDMCCPDSSPVLFPALQLLRAGDHRTELFLAPVDNPCVRTSGILRVYILTVYPWRHDDLVSRLRHIRGILDMPKRPVLTAVSLK